jgi:hypothetical protein
MNDSESPSAGSSDDDTWGNSTITFQETGGSPTVSSSSFNVTYNNTLSAGIVTVPAAASVWLQKVQEFEGAVGTSGSSGSGSSSSSSGSSGATSSASAGSSGSSGSSSSSSSSSSGNGSSSSSSSSSAPGATGNAAAAGPAARAVQAPPMPSSGGMMVASGAMTMPAMNGMSAGGGLGLSGGMNADDDGQPQSGGGGMFGWFWRLLGYGDTQTPTPPPEPFDPPPAGGDQYAEFEELQQQFTDADRAGIIDPNNTLRMAIVDNNNGKPFKGAMADVHTTLFVVFPIYAGGVLLEVSATLSGPEELAALRLLLAAKGLILQTVKQGGKQILRIVENNAKKKIAKLTENEAKALINKAKHDAAQALANQVKTEIHHIASNKGAWEKRFAELFKKAGMSLDDAVNKMDLPFHNGRHIEEYHKFVYERLQKAIANKATEEEARKALTKELQKLREDLLKNPRLPYSDGGLR